MTAWSKKTGSKLSGPFCKMRTTTCSLWKDCKSGLTCRIKWLTFQCKETSGTVKSARNLLNCFHLQRKCPIIQKWGRFVHITSIKRRGIKVRETDFTPCRADTYRYLGSAWACLSCLCLPVTKAWKERLERRRNNDRTVTKRRGNEEGKSFWLIKWR